MVLYYLSHPFAALPLLAGMKEFKRKLYKKFRIKAINRFKPDIVHFEFSPIAIDYADEIDLLCGKKIVSCRGTGEKVKTAYVARTAKKV